MKVAIYAFIVAAAVFGIVMSELKREDAAEDLITGQVARAANMARVLKKAMRDPDSFKLSSVLIIENTGAVCYEYRSRNGFGGMTVGQAVLSPKGKFTTSEMDGFHAFWKTECSGKMGRDEAGAVSLLLGD